MLILEWHKRTFGVCSLFAAKISLIPLKIEANFSAGIKDIMSQKCFPEVCLKCQAKHMLIIRQISFLVQRWILLKGVTLGVSYRLNSDGGIGFQTERDFLINGAGGVWTLNSKLAACQVWQIAEEDKNYKHILLVDHSIPWDCP